MQITGGKVTFMRSVQPAQYETKKAEVELTFVLAEGEQLGDQLDLASTLAVDKALEMVGLRKAPTVAASSTPTVGGKEAYAAAAAKPEAKVEKPAEDKKPRKPPNPAKDKAEEPTAGQKAADKLGNISTTPEDRKDPAEMTDDDVLGTDADDLDAMLGDAAPEPITDKQLVEKIGLKNKSLAEKNAGIPQPRKIKELITKYAPHAHSIPAEKRAKFLEELEALS